METILSALESVDFSFETYIKAALILALGTFLLGVISRLVFGKRSSVNHAVSSAIGILFLYAATIVIYSAGAQFQAFIAPLPFVNFVGDKLTIFSFQGADYTIICSQILSMVILAFLVNLIDSLLPKGKHIISWFLYRCLTVVLAMALHLLVTWLFTTYLPEGIVTYAPVILLALLVILLLVGALKLLVGMVLATVNPLIGLLYTFFFATMVGKQLSKAVLTTLLLSLLVYLLNRIGLVVISIASAVLIAYIPLLVVLAIVWYLVHQVL